MAPTSAPPRHLPRALASAALTVAVALLALPVLAVLASWLQWDAVSAQILREMAATVLPDYALTSLWLCLMVAVGVTAVGTGAAIAVTLFDFRLRRFFEWAMLLPLAMPAYVVAYAYTDFLQFSGPLQTWLRAGFGLEGRVLPEVRSLGGAVWVFIFALYPYVYLLARTALAERAAQLMEAARLLGASPWRRIREVALPLVRPAVVAGLSLALMETLADYGVASYFGIQTFSAGIYKAWLVMDNRVAAAQLATVLLLLVAVLLALEQRAQRRMRYAAGRVDRVGSDEARPFVLRGAGQWLAWLACAIPVLMGFVAPLVFMLRPLLADWGNLPWRDFGHWVFNSLRLGLTTALLATGLALALAFALRMRSRPLVRLAARVAGLGYAVPGTVVVVGLLLPVGWLQAQAPETRVGMLVTATVAGVIWAYPVRFCAVALQPVQSGYARIAPSLDESARMLGAGNGRLLRQVHAPLLRRSLIAALLLVFVDVMKELPATLVLRPFNTDTLAVMAYQLARDERLGEAALPSLALVAVGLIPVILLSRALREPDSR